MPYYVECQAAMTEKRENARMLLTASNNFYGQEDKILTDGQRETVQEVNNGKRKCGKIINEMGDELLKRDGPVSNKHEQQETD